jgi:hypothetical protein
MAAARAPTLTRLVTQIAGQQFICDGIEDCKIHVLDHCAQVTVDDAKRCEIIIGPCEDSLFLRGCEGCTVYAVCRQLRTRDCVDCKFYLFVLTDPVIESSHSCEFGAWNIAYPLLDQHFRAANLDPAEPNLYKKIYDFTPDEHPDHTHWVEAAELPSRVMDVEGMTELPVNPLRPDDVAVAAGSSSSAAAATTASSTEGDGGGGAAAAATEEGEPDPCLAYSLVKPKRFAIKRSPPTLIVEVSVLEPAKQSGARRLLVRARFLRSLIPTARPGDLCRVSVGEDCTGLCMRKTWLSPSCNPTCLSVRRAREIYLTCGVRAQVYRVEGLNAATTDFEAAAAALTARMPRFSNCTHEAGACSRRVMMP